MKILHLIIGLVVGIGVGLLVPQVKEEPETESAELPAILTPADTTPRVEKPKSSDAVAELEEQNRLLREELDRLHESLAGYQAEEMEELEIEKAAKAKWIAFRLDEYRGLFELSPEQERKIGEWEWESHEYWAAFQQGRLDPEEEEPISVPERVKEILSEEQLEIYEAHLKARSNSIAAMVAQSTLSQYPITLKLTEEQKDSIYSKLYLMTHEDSSGEYAESRKALEEEGYQGTDANMLLAAEEVLTAEQLEQLKETLRAGAED